MMISRSIRTALLASALLAGVALPPAVHAQQRGGTLNYAYVSGRARSIRTPRQPGELEVIHHIRDAGGDRR